MAARILTPQEIAFYAYRAGFRGQALNIAVAVAMAESGGNPVAYNPESAAGTKPGSGSRGLWQIYGTAHPWANTPQIFDPQLNANAAFRVFREAGNSFRPWSTYNQGMAKPKWNFANMNFGSVPPASQRRSTGTPIPTQQVDQGVQVTQGVPRQQQGQPATRVMMQNPAAAFSGASLNGDKTESNPLAFLDGTPLGIFTGGEDSKGRDIEDLTMFISGFILIIIGIVLLFTIGGLKFAGENKGLVEDAAKFAAGI